MKFTDDECLNFHEFLRSLEQCLKRKKKLKVKKCILHTYIQATALAKEVIHNMV